MSKQITIDVKTFARLWDEVENIFRKLTEHA